MSRTPWFNCKNDPPVNGDENSEYEWRCLQIYKPRRRTILWMRLCACSKCEWRGLTRPAEES